MDNQPVIHIQNFEGPLDLLLHLIKSASIDIYDIPIVEITDQYMTALRQMEDHQLDVAGDYFVMAATLMKMKAKLLLPQQAEDDAEDDEPLWKRCRPPWSNSW
ncbi:segregation and condensation protein A [Secundilactobacillus paracollinoides]|uniref:segregation and condensation protein A n=1 Tax=Secundilactobacillus paracollinoides TaxID=240427 RepID=UPI0006D27B74|nr:segregation/condensation protein A [Secundilactobacillus paracollinoides]